MMKRFSNSSISILQRRKFDRKNINFMKILLAISCSVTLAICIFSTLNTHWANSDVYYEHRGLWKFCYGDKNGTECVDLSDPKVQQLTASHINNPSYLSFGETPQWLYICRTTIIIAASASFIALILAIVGLFSKVHTGFLCSFFMVVCFTTLVSSVLLYSEHTEFKEERVSCGPGWIAGWFGSILAFSASFMGLCAF